MYLPTSLLAFELPAWAVDPFFWRSLVFEIYHNRLRVNVVIRVVTSDTIKKYENWEGHCLCFQPQWFCVQTKKRYTCSIPDQIYQISKISTSYGIRTRDPRLERAMS